MASRAILIIEDEHALGTALSFLVRRMGHLPTLSASGAAGLAEMERTSFAAVVLDIGLPDMSGLKVLEQLRQNHSDLPVLVITAHATLDHAIHAQKSGATGYLTKPLDLKHFEQTLGAMLSPGFPMTGIQTEISEVHTTTLIGAAPCLRETFTGIARACSGDIPALITGPGGSGKSLAAAVIHAHSRRSGQPMLVLPCSQISNPAEFERGGGTLVLEELTALSADIQGRLAVWLENPGKNHPRILATTIHDPRESVRRGTLREDLYYAMATLTIPLPPLSERTGDIPALSAWFAGLRGQTFAPPLTPPVLGALQAYPWPGNVRELRHVLEYANTLSGGGPVFLSHLPSHVSACSSDSAPAPGELETVIGRWLDASLSLPEDERHGYDTLLDRIEGVMLKHLLGLHENRPTRLAAALDMHRATLRQKLRRCGLHRDDS